MDIFAFKTTAFHQISFFSDPVLIRKKNLFTMCERQLPAVPAIKSEISSRIQMSLF